MKKLLMMISILCSLGLIASTALAAVSNKQNAPGTTSTVVGQSKVPQAQIDRVKKRDEMNKRRAELLKLRQQLIDSNSPGNVDGQQKLQ